jgi:hypothetical protein
MHISFYILNITMALAYEGDNYRSKRSYITTGAFNGSIFQYTTQLNGTTLSTEGRLTAITTSPNGTTLTAANCPRGRILREVGAKLYPGVHPGLAVGDTFSGAVVGTTATNKYWVKVFDAQTGVRGFIDPNAAIFTVYNSDKALEIQDPFENAGGAPTRLGQPIFTAGDVIAGGQVRSSTVTTDSTSVSGTLTINPTLGQVFRFTATMSGAVTLAATAGSAAAAPGSIVYIVFANGGGQTVIGDQSTVLTPTSATMTNAKGYAITLISNGVTFVQVSAVQLNVTA